MAKRLPGSPISPLECLEFRAFLQHADRVLTMKACHLDEFIANFFPPFASAGSINSRLVATLGCLLNLPPVPSIGMGNICHEATGRAG